MTSLRPHNAGLALAALMGAFHSGWALLVLAGGVSNFAERVVRGSVRDFIPLADGVLNIADFYILTGAVLLLWVFRRRT
jgi:lipoprotein signal peptidase